MKLKSFLFLSLFASTCSAAFTPIAAVSGLGGWIAHFYYEYNKSKVDLEKKKKTLERKNQHEKKDTKIQEISPEQIIKNMPYQKLAASGILIGTGVSGIHLLQKALSKENKIPLLPQNQTPLQKEEDNHEEGNEDRSSDNTEQEQLTKDAAAKERLAAEQSTQAKHVKNLEKEAQEEQARLEKEAALIKEREKTAARDKKIAEQDAANLSSEQAQATSEDEKSRLAQEHIARQNRIKEIEEQERLVQEKKTRIAQELLLAEAKLQEAQLATARFKEEQRAQELQQEQEEKNRLKKEIEEKERIAQAQLKKEAEEEKRLAAIKAKKLIPVEQKELSEFNSAEDFVEYYASFYGYKAANELYIDMLYKNNSSIQTPASYRLSDENVWNIFTDQQKENINKEYTAFQEELKNKKELTDQAKQHLNAIRIIINRSNDVQFQHLFFNPEISEFKRQAKEKKYLLVFRSTGREDSKDLSNAGGNDSVSAVKPKSKDMINAAKQVLSSYFSEKSISQRLAAQDPQLTEGSFFIPLLLNCMIGENSGPDQNEIPRSGVLFSTEAEGETTGLTKIEATYGHNEAVVNSLLPVDTYYINKDFSLRSVICKKEHRLMPKLHPETKKYELKKEKNDSKKITLSTLSKEEILKLARIAKQLEQKYGYPVDIEFVIQNKIIYIVQVRPLEKRQKDPTFLRTEYIKTIDLSDTISAEMVGIGHAQATKIENIDQLIFDSTLKKAIDNQLPTKEEEVKNIKGIIITQMAGSTSHEATIARSHQIPVFVINQIETIKQKLKEGKHLLLDPQRNTLFIIDPSTEDAHHIQKGWFAHPIVAKASMIPESITPLSTIKISEEISEEHFNQIKQLSKKTSHKLLEEIKYQEDVTQAIDATYALLYKVESKIQNVTKTCTKNPECKAQLKILRATFLSAIQEQLIALEEEKVNSVQDDTTRLQRLYPTAALEAIIYQIPNEKNIYDFSLAAVLIKEKRTSEIIKKYNLTQNDLYLIPYLEVSHHALIPELKGAYENFIIDLKAATPVQKAAFKEMFNSLVRSDALPLWINTSVEEALGQHGATFTTVYQSLINEYNDSKVHIEHFQAITAEFSSFPIDSFANPEAFDQLWKDFNEDLLTKYILDQSFIDHFEASPRLGKIIATTLLKKTIDTFDLSIKALTGSPLYKKDQIHIERFKKMLNRYFALFTHLCSIPSLQQDLNNLCPRCGWEPGTPVKTICIKEYIENKSICTWQEPSYFRPHVEYFTASPYYNVFQYMLGSQADMLYGSDRCASSTPTCETFFSLTHQNLLVINGLICKKVGLDTIKLPKQAAEFKENFERLIIKDGLGTYKLALMGVDFSPRTICFKYNMAMRHHSSTYQLEYDRKTEQFTLSGMMIGQNVKNKQTGIGRWTTIVEIIKTIQLLGDLKATKPMEINEEKEYLSFSWQVEDPEKTLTLFPLVIKSIDNEGDADYLNVLVKTLFKTENQADAYEATFKKISTNEIFKKISFYEKLLSCYAKSGIGKKPEAIAFILNEVDRLIAESKTIDDNVFYIIDYALNFKWLSKDQVFQKIKHLDSTKYPMMFPLLKKILEPENAHLILNQALTFIGDFHTNKTAKYRNEFELKTRLIANLYRVSTLYGTAQDLFETEIIFLEGIDKYKAIKILIKNIKKYEKLREERYENFLYAALQMPIETEQEKKILTSFFELIIDKTLNITYYGQFDDLRENIRQENIDLLLEMYQTKAASLNFNSTAIENLVKLFTERKLILKTEANYHRIKAIISQSKINEYLKEKLTKELDDFFTA